MTDETWLDPATWQACGHAARFPCCAGCGTDLDPHFGEDGPTLVAFGVCKPCATTTVWQAVVVETPEESK